MIGGKGKEERGVVGRGKQGWLEMADEEGEEGGRNRGREIIGGQGGEEE